MNWAAIFSFLHPMLTVIITSGIVLYILKKDYSSTVAKIVEEKENEERRMAK